MIRSSAALFAVVAIATAGLGTPAPAWSQDPEPEPPDPGPFPLFMSHEPLELTLEADFDKLKGDRGQESEERPANLIIKGEGGETAIDLMVRTRGNFRLQRRNCSFPPLRLNLPKSRVEGTVFEGQDKLKLVVHCQDRDNYEQYVLKEYLVYRVFNVLTDESFGVRLARITYVDTSGDDDPVTRYAFILEDNDAVAARIGGNMSEQPQVHPAWVEPGYASMMSVFQYMMGNTDWSLVALHNVEPVRTDDGRLLAVPYDFDWTGAVSARYARPDPQLPIRNVRQRVYRGFCWEGVDYQALYARFNEAKDEIYALYEQLEALEEDERKKSLEYLDDFYEVINDEREAERKIAKACRNW